MDERHAIFLRRLTQAHRNWAQSGHDPEQFALLAKGGMERELVHPAWDRSWPTPTHLDIDELEELGYVRVLDGTGLGRAFALTVAGRRAGEQLDQAVTFPVSAGDGRAPSAFDTLRWLVAAADAEPSLFDTPSRILDRAVIAGFIAVNARQALARRIRELAHQGYITGMFPDVDQLSAEQELANAQDLALTVEAYKEAQSATAESAPGAPISVYYNIINSQVAGGDITTSTTFIDVLAEIEVTLDRLDDVDPAVKEEAKGLLRRLLGKSTAAAGGVATDAAGALVSALLAKYLHLPPG